MAKLQQQAKVCVVHLFNCEHGYRTNNLNRNALLSQKLIQNRLNMQRKLYRKNLLVQRHSPQQVMVMHIIAIFHKLTNQDMQECTFKPKTNPVHRNMSSAQQYVKTNIFERLRYACIHFFYLGYKLLHSAQNADEEPQWQDKKEITFDHDPSVAYDVNIKKKNVGYDTLCH